MKPCEQEIRFIIETISKLVEINPDDLMSISDCFESRTINKSQFLLKEGEVCDFWGFIYQGIVRSYTPNDRGEEYTNGFIMENDFICQFLSFQSRKPSSVNVHALEDTKLVFLSHKELQKVYSRFPIFEKFARKLYEDRFAQAKAQMLFRVQLSATDRYLYLLEKRPSLIQRVPLKYLASYLNITDSTLSRVRRKISHLPQ
ncbi:Crp/Fnr family transcriptional regulator [Pedobacter sp. L105]|uniref:Crp/Fnr family transcriptional regulator n=1 Tax=Pedobacter sp. L105 TaxID=1641871 RepID=UPI00131A76C0|nr:Crp/Fnr family transcriptional regulator [Pedobacter sp. L105]